ncbi:major facilitator superfamily domain-containing protein [Sporodiniella umbellata]|nr:major facilitator superfamily domain-containing protein [Sporodiniella umbellata]
MVYCVLIACLGSFSNGWVIGSPNVPGQITHQCENGDRHVQNSYFPDCLPMEDALWGFAVASFCVGGLMGGLSGGLIQTRLGRKKTLIVNNAGFILGGLLIACAVNSSMFVLGRILCGLSCGVASLTVPTYIGEISTVPSRGAMGTCNQFFIVIGILLSSVVGFPLATVALWRVSYVLVAVPAFIQLLLMTTCIESPRYLISVNRIEEARAALVKLRGSDAVEDEFYAMLAGQLGAHAAQTLLQREVLPENSKSEEEKEIVAEQTGETHAPMGILQVFMDPVIRRIALTVIALHAFQQLVGINAVMYYSTTIFRLAFDEEMSKYMTIITSVVNFVTTILAVILVDRMGRRPLLLIASAGAVLFCVLLVIGYVYTIPHLLVASVFLYVASFAIGIGPIPWMITSEITPTYASSTVGSLGTSVNWSFNFLIGQCFPVIFAQLAGYSFIFFAVFALLCFLFTFFCLPETKGRSLESIVQGYEKYRA